MPVGFAIGVLTLLLLALVGIAAFGLGRWLGILAKKREIKRLLRGRSVATTLDTLAYVYVCGRRGAQVDCWIIDKRSDGNEAILLRVSSELDAQLWILRHAPRV